MNVQDLMSGFEPTPENMRNLKTEMATLASSFDNIGAIMPLTENEEWADVQLTLHGLTAILEIIESYLDGNEQITITRGQAKHLIDFLANTLKEDLI